MAGSPSLYRFHLEGVRDTGRVIGEGAYAVVKELKFRGLKCAGKKLHDKSASRQWRADMLQRFAAECEVLDQLHHPHLVQFLGVHVEVGSELPQLVMEYLPTSLGRCLDTHGALPAEINCSILLDVSLGLRYLHEFSPPIIHRDLSSDNILLTTSMTAKISDLGVAKILAVSPTRAARTTQTQAPGISTFMPPEALSTTPKYTTEVDIFSFGVVMVHSLSGEWPIPNGAFAEDTREPSRRISVTEFERRRESIDKISEGHPLLGLIEQCLSNVANHRPDAAEVVRHLQAEHARVPPSPDNRLELLQQVQSLRAELQLSSGEECESLGSEEVDWQTQCSSLEAVRAELQREVKGLRAELTLSREKSQTEIESLGTQVQQLTTQQRTTPPKANRVQSPPGLSPQTRLQWRRGAVAPMEFSEANAVVMGESVFVGGGFTENMIFQYNWRREAWSTLLCPVKFFGLTQFMGRLMTVGGSHLLAGSVTGCIYEFVTESQQWQESLPPMPTARSSATAVTRSSSSSKPPAVIVCGGRGDGWVVLNTVEVYCHSSQWHTAEPLPTPLWGLTSATVSDITYLLGGASSTMLCFSVSLDSLINKVTPVGSRSRRGSLWKTLSDVPVTYSCAASLGDMLVAIGGQDSRTLSSSAAIHLLSSNGSWERVSGGDLPEPRHWPAAVCLPSGELMVAGGSSGKGFTDTLFIASVVD